MRAEGWSRMPLVRMTNLHLEPGAGTLEELIADVDDGVFFETNRSWSIDDKRLNFQFGTQIAWEIKHGKLGRMLRDATYTGITPQFWGSLDAVGGPETWRLYGLTNCGKGQPGQGAHVSHGAPRRRFRERPDRRPLVTSRASSPRRRSRPRPRSEAEVVVHSRALRARPVRGLGGAPADADRERTSSNLRVVRDGRVGGAQTNRLDDEALARARAPDARGRRDARRPSRTSPALPARRAAGRGRGLRRGDGRARAGRSRADRRAARSTPPRAARALRLRHERRDRGRRRLDHRDRRRAAAHRRQRAGARRRRGRVGLRGARRLARSAPIDPAAAARGGAPQGRGAREAATRSSRRTTARCSSRTRSPSCSQHFAYDSLQRASACSSSAASSRAGSASRSSTSGSRSPTTRSTRPGCRRRSTSRATPKQRVPLIEDGVARGVVWDREHGRARAGEAARPATRRPSVLARLRPAAVRALGRGRRGGLGRGARRARRRRHLRHAPALPQQSSPRARA